MWNDSREMKGIDGRARLVHGVPYAGFSAMAELIRVRSGRTLDTINHLEFQKHLVAHCSDQVAEVRRHVNVDRFWTDVLAALAHDSFGHSRKDLMRLFLVRENKNPRERVWPQEQIDQLRFNSGYGWKSYLLFFQAEPVINIVKEYKRRIGESTYLDESDLMAQMMTRAYWVKSPEKDRHVHRQRFGDTKSHHSCWSIDVDLHPMGLDNVDAESWRRSLFPDGTDMGVRVDQWIDPRRGDLFTLIDKVLEREESPHE